MSVRQIDDAASTPSGILRDRTGRICLETFGDGSSRDATQVRFGPGGQAVLVATRDPRLTLNGGRLRVGTPASTVRRAFRGSGRLHADGVTYTVPATAADGDGLITIFIFGPAHRVSDLTVADTTRLHGSPPCGDERRNPGAQA
jgi:hypothetical protein